jgi:putative membrane-bound dehydrogenase-like protein
MRQPRLFAALCWLPLAATMAGAAEDPYKDQGNVEPKAVKLTAEQEAAILKDVQVADGFEATVFAPSQMVNYPIFVAASPDGTVFVGSDGNGAQGKSPHRGRIVRLRDTDGDGRADEAKLFVKDVDSPRGLVWDKDRLYVVHPPNLSVYIDKDGDGVADEEQVLVKGIGWSFADRAADHATNGLTLGIDGWLYIAGGDFGIIEATGADGRKLQHRAGGVIRVRTDGTGLEVFSTGTRNILEVATSPLLDHFARDNTNDGGGWDVRFHYFAGLEDNGYPRLYRHFADEAVTPLNDYGGGSGCGAVWIDEPGFGTWNDAPFTVDWGTGSLFRHSVERVGASYRETGKPKSLIKMTKPTDADVDAMGNVYVASWKGAVFNWAGPDVGYLVRLHPKGFVPEPLPDFAKADAAQLEKLLASPSHRRRLAAQRELVRRAAADPAAAKAQGAALRALADDAAQPLKARVAALAALHQASPPPAFPKRAAGDPLGEYDLRFAAENGAPIVVDAIDRDDPRCVLQALDAAVKSKQLREVLPIAEPWMEKDARIAHVAARALGALGDPALCFERIDRAQATPAVRTAALRGLAMMHQAAAVDGLIARLATVGDPGQRRGLLTALCRLHFVEGPWKGDGWGTRPDNRGPYYQPEVWAETPKVIAALKAALAAATPDEAAFLVAEMNRNRIKSDEALARILALAKQDPAHLPAVTGQLAASDDIPAEAVPLLIQAARLEKAAPGTYAEAVMALAKVDSGDGVIASLAALDALGRIPGAEREQNAAGSAFRASIQLDNHVPALAATAAAGGALGQLADGALLGLAGRKTGSPEAREAAAKALDEGWKEPKRRAQILRAVGEGKYGFYTAKVQAALADGDAEVAKAAKQAAEKLGLNKQVKDTTPVVRTLKREEVLAQIMTTKGDAGLGEQLFTRLSCVGCHTTNQDQQPKGPYLGNIAQTYKRAELAENILDPNKSIAQGFITNLVALKDGSQQVGFVTFESPDKLTLRTVAAQELSFATKDIVSRTKLPTSMMPPGLVDGLTVREFSSLLDYLEALARK